MEAPQRVGQYRLIKKIADGGMAEVYLAARGSEGFEKRVALKMILPFFAQDPAFERSFIDEARLCGFLQHPNLVQVYEFQRAGSSLFLAMEFIEGLDLERIIYQNQELHRVLPAEAAAEILLQILEGLDAAHTAKDQETEQPLNIVHRDLKPSNILIDRSGLIKIVDFGVAKASTNRYKTINQGTAKGTVSYMSPEQASGRLDLGPPSDLFSVGAILYEMLTSERLFDGENLFQILDEVRNGPLEQRLSAPRIPAIMQGLLKKALARDLSQRYATAREMAREVRQTFPNLAGPLTLARLVDQLAAEGLQIVSATDDRSPSPSRPPREPTRQGESALLHRNETRPVLIDPGPILSESAEITEFSLKQPPRSDPIGPPRHLPTQLASAPVKPSSTPPETQDITPVSDTQERTPISTVNDVSREARASFLSDDFGIRSERGQGSHVQAPAEERASSHSGPGDSSGAGTPQDLGSLADFESGGALASDLLAERTDEYKISLRQRQGGAILESSPELDAGESPLLEVESLVGSFGRHGASEVQTGPEGSALSLPEPSLAAVREQLPGIGGLVVAPTWATPSADAAAASSASLGRVAAQEVQQGRRLPLGHDALLPFSAPAGSDAALGPPHLFQPLPPLPPPQRPGTLASPLDEIPTKFVLPATLVPPGGMDAAPPGTDDSFFSKPITYTTRNATSEVRLPVHVPSGTEPSTAGGPIRAILVGFGGTLILGALLMTLYWLFLVKSVTLTVQGIPEHCSVSWTSSPQPRPNTSPDATRSDWEMVIQHPPSTKVDVEVRNAAGQVIRTSVARPWTVDPDDDRTWKYAFEPAIRSEECTGSVRPRVP